MSIDVKVENIEVKVTTDEEGLPIEYKVKGIKEEEVIGTVGKQFFQRLPMDYVPGKELREAIIKAFFTTTAVSCKIGLKFRDVLRYAAATLELGFFYHIDDRKNEIRKAIKKGIEEIEEIQKRSRYPKDNLEGKKLPEDIKKTIRKEKRKEEKLRFFEYKPSESDLDYFQRVIGNLSKINHLEELTQNSMEYYKKFKNK